MKAIFNVGSVSLTAGAQTGGGLRSIDLFARSPIPEEVAIALKVVSNGTAPGAGKTVTAHCALAAEPNLTVAQLDEADSEQVLNLANAANTERVYTLPTIICGQRYLYLWFDNVALAAGATLTITPKINNS